MHSMAKQFISKGHEMKLFQNLNVLCIEEHCASCEKNVVLMRDIGLNVLETDSLDSTNDLLKHNKIDKKSCPLPSVLIANELHNGFSYDPINKCFVTADDEDVQLTKKEYLLIEFFIKNKNKLVTFEQIESAVWVYSVMSNAALRTLIHEIRKKSYDDIVTNYSGIGYKLNV